MVLSDGLKPAFVGLIAGVVLALSGGRLIEGLLFGVNPWDPAILLGVPLILSLVAAVALFAPAARASRVDPLLALRAR